MRNIIKLLGLGTLVVFSFFYTDKVIEVIREEDNIMVELKELESLYEVDAVDASVAFNTIVPGINGRKINLDKSYKEMKSIGVVNKNMLVYDVVKPSVSISDNRDKFIIRGNPLRNMVSLVFILDDDKYLERLEEVVDSKGIVINYFVDYDFLINNSTVIKGMSDREFYSYGDGGEYTPDNLLFSNNLITRISSNEAFLCFDTTMDSGVIKLCSDNELYTVTPSLVVDKDIYKNIKDNLVSGSIILIDMGKDNISNLGIVIDYIRGKGLDIKGLSELISEELILKSNLDS